MNCQLPIADGRLLLARFAYHGSCSAAVALLLAGCAQPRVVHEVNNRVELRRRAMECLKAAVAYRHNAVVRIEAVEALKGRRSAEDLPWIRSAMLDEHPAVRFAACVAVGEARDAEAETGVARCLKDADASVRLAALFARHRLGHTQRTGDLAGYFLKDPDATVRRNAALVLGLLGEQGAVKILAKGMKDADTGVRDHALEAMARLESREARQELTFMTGAGVGSDEVFAINALAATADPSYAETFRYKLATAAHLETRLAAARGLGLLHSDKGFGVAMRALRLGSPRRDDPQDPVEGQTLRTQQLAAAALGAIGRTDALPALTEVLEKSDDPRVQVSAAAAILDILEADRTSAWPLATAGSRRER